MTAPEHNKAVRLASVLYGTVAFLSAALAVSPEQFTVGNVISGGTVIGVATLLTYYFKEIVFSPHKNYGCRLVKWRGLIIKSEGDPL